MSDDVLAASLYDSIDLAPHVALTDDVAHLTIHHNKVIASHLLPGLEADVSELADGIEAEITVKNGVVIPKPIHMCFGMLPEEGLQHIVLNIHMEEHSRASVIAHCTFPNAVKVEHRMDAEITVDEAAHYSYFERHVHGPEGGVLVIPRAKVTVRDHARFRTEFELIRGRVGAIDIDYETISLAHSVMEMTARISGRGNDSIRIRETGRLFGEGARGVLTSYIAVRDEARAEVYNTIAANAPFARGHVDCKEIVQDKAVAKAVPIVEVWHPKAHVTHEAAIGSVDSKQLETLMSRGLSESDAVELIIEGLLS